MTRSPEPPPTPHLDRRAALADKLETLDAFLRWLLEVRGYVLARVVGPAGGEELEAARGSIEELLAEHLGLDPLREAGEVKAIVTWARSRFPIGPW